MQLKRFYHVVFIISAAIWAFVIIYVQARYPDPPGADGYFYLKQITVLSSGGGYYYKDHSLAFLVPAFIASITGDPLQAYRVAVSVICSLLIFSGGALAYLSATASGLKERDAAALFFLATAALCCTLSIYEFTFQYYKNAFAILLLLAAVLIHLYGPGSKGKITAFALVHCEVITHKNGFGVTNLVLLRSPLHGRKRWVKASRCPGRPASAARQ